MAEKPGFSNLFGLTHTGAWGTPELKISEKLSDLFGQSRNKQGGSQLSAGTNAKIGLGGTYQPNQIRTWQTPGVNNYPDSPTITTKAYTEPVSGTGDTGGTDGGGNPNPVYKTPEGWDYQGTQDQYNAEIDAYYNAAMGALSTAEQNLNKNLDITKTQAESDYAANSAQLGTNRTSTMGTIDTQQRAGQTRKEDALSAARRLFQQLSQGNQQRFGGSTSAGQAASEIQGAEMQRQMGSTNRQTNEFMQQIDTAKRDVESQYQSGLLQLQQAKQQALSDAQISFNNAITEIAQNRAQTEAQKAQMRMNALMDLRNKAFTIQQQNVTFEQQLTAMREQAKLNLENYNKTTTSNLANTTSAYNTQTTNMNTPYDLSKVGASSYTPTQPEYIGSIGKSKVGTLPDGRTLYSDGTAGWSNR